MNLCVRLALAIAVLVSSGLAMDGSLGVAASTQTVATVDSYATAVEMATLVGGGSLSGLDRIIVVTGESFPDAVMASGLAGFLDEGGRSGRTAILLTRANELPAVVADAIGASGVAAAQVLMVGGTAAVSDDVRAAVARAAGWEGSGANPVVRIAGANRYETSAAIVDYVITTASSRVTTSGVMRMTAAAGLPESYRTVLVASGEQFPDAVAAATLAYRNGHVLLLAPSAGLTVAVENAVGRLQANQAVLVGGTAVLPPQVANQVASILGAGARVERVAGHDRFDTAAQIAQRFVAAHGAPREAMVVSGVTFADSLATGPLAGGNRPLLLTPPNRLSEPTRQWLQQHAGSIVDVRVIGGANTIDAAVVSQVNGAVTPPSQPAPPAPVPDPAPDPAPPAAMVPLAPTIAGVTAGDGLLSVDFVVGGDGGSAITNVEYSIDGGATWVARSPVSVVSPLVITGLTNGTPYDVRIRAVNAQGSGDASTAESGTPEVPCAEGGLCGVGDVGPGGGVVFYVHPGGGTFTCGPSLNLTCRYLEAWTHDATTSAGGVTMHWSGTTNVSVGTTGIVIGAGYKNTIDAVAQNSTADRAITVARLPRGGKDDWYLPSRDELNELCKFARQQATGNTAVECASGGTLREGFLSHPSYWSSSETLSDRALAQFFRDGYRAGGDKGLSLLVRPIRAF